jgi:Zn-dependent protease
MLQYLFSNPISFLIWAAALLTAVTIHEFAHAWMADRLGDPTARLRGRLTLNPLAHLDPIGTLMLLFFRFGWGKPVPIDPFNLRNPRRDTALISCAGPGSNLILAIFLSILIRSSHLFLGPVSLIIGTIFLPFVLLNVMLAIFNLIPIHPLDGGKILVGLLPEKTGQEIDEFLHRYGLILLLLLIFPFFGSSPVIALISPIISFILTVFLPGTSFI